jgi:hypothetical protein
MNASLRLYRRIAFGFVIIVAVVLALVLYVSTVRATIHVKPVEETVSVEFLLDVVPTPTRTNEIRGKVVSGTLNKTQTVTPSGEGTKQVEGKSTGTVTIYNTSAKAQGLVATTRLLDPHGVLFRIDKDVNVPAGGTVTVSVHADQAGATGDIGPSKFTIPGLSVSLQALIYAQSTETFTGGVSTVAAVSQADIDRAFADLKASLEEDAKAMLRDQAGDTFSGESFSSTIVDQKSTVAAGSEASSFDVSMTLQAIGVFFDRDAAQKLAIQQLYGKLEDGKEFANVNTDGITASVEKVDLATNAVNVRVYADGVSVTSNTSSSLDAGRFAGMSGEEVKQTLVSEHVAEDVTVSFFPFWVHKVPNLKDHIYIEME